MLKSKSWSISVFYFTEQNCCPLPGWTLTNRARTRVADPTAGCPQTSDVHGQSAVHILKGILHKTDSKKESNNSRHGCSKRKQITIVKTWETMCLKKMSVLIFSSSQTPVCETSNFVAFFNCMRIVDVKNNEKDLFTKLNSSYLNYLMTHRKGYLSYFYWNHL